MKLDEDPPIMTVKQFCARYSWPSEAGMRSYIFNAKRYGLEDAFVRVGRRILINHKTFFWLLQNQNKK